MLTKPRWWRLFLKKLAHRCILVFHENFLTFTSKGRLTIVMELKEKLNLKSKQLQTLLNQLKGVSELE